MQLCVGCGALCTTVRLGFPSLTEVQAASAEGPLRPPLPAAIIWRPVCHPLNSSPASQRSVSEPARLSSPPSLALAALTTKRRFVLKEGKKKKKKYVEGKKRKEEKKEEKTASTMLPGVR